MPNPQVIRQVTKNIKELNPPDDLEEQIIASLDIKPEEEE